MNVFVKIILTVPNVMNVLLVITTSQHVKVILNKFIVNCSIKLMHYSYIHFQLVIVIYKGHLILLAMIMVYAVVKLILMVTNVIHVLQVIPSFHHAKVDITTNSNPV